MNLAPVRGSYLESYCGASPICGPARAESPTSPQPRATPWVPCSQSLRPVRAKVKVNHSPILLPLQGVGDYTLIPRALPWAMNWLPFQGARGEGCGGCPFQGRWRLFTNLDFYGILNTLPFRGSAAATNITKKNLTIASSLRNRQILFFK